MAFDIKAALNEAKIESLKIQDAKERKAYLDTRTREIREHSEMLRKMSGFVNAKNKNSPGNGQHGTF